MKKTTETSTETSSTETMGHNSCNQKKKFEDTIQYLGHNSFGALENNSSAVPDF